MAAEPGCNGRDKAVAADAGRLARVHEQEAARAVGILGLAGGEAALTEQRGLLVARRARDGNFHALDVAGAEVALLGRTSGSMQRGMRRTCRSVSSQSRRRMSKSMVP